MKRSVPMALVAACAVMALAACGGGDSGDDGSASSDISVGFAVPASNQTYWTAYINSVEEAAEELGVDVTFADAKDDANSQVEQVATFVTKQVDGIVLVPVDTTGPKAAVEATVDSGIPLVTSNRVLDTDYGGVDGAIPMVHTGFDDVAIGEINGDLLADACADLDPCSVVSLTANLGISVQVQRSGGQEAVIEENPNITVLASQPDDFDATKAADVTASWLQKYSDIDFLTCHYDEMCIAAADVLAEQGRDDIGVIGIGGSKNGIAAVEDGTMAGTAWVSPVLDGRYALETIVAIINGESVAAEDVNGIPTVPVPAAAVTLDNVTDHPGEW